MSTILRSIRVVAVLATFAALAAGCGKSITAPTPDYGDPDTCVIRNGHLICR